MWKETDIAGVFVSPLVAYGLVALLIFLAIRPVLIWLRFQRWTWNTPLAETCVYVCILALLLRLL
jgi:hypothetical protein